MKKHDVDKRRATATNSGPSRQVIPRETKGLTAVKGITFQYICEPPIVPPEVFAGADDEWESWAASHHDSAL